MIMPTKLLSPWLYSEAQMDRYKVDVHTTPRFLHVYVFIIVLLQLKVFLDITHNRNVRRHEVEETLKHQ